MSEKLSTNRIDDVQTCEEQIIQIWEDDPERADEAYEETIRPRFSWETVQSAVINILKSEQDKGLYEFASGIIWYALLDEECIDDGVLIALLNLRLNTEDKPYWDNRAWSITSELYHLSYDNSEYNAFKDLRLEWELNKIGLSFHETKTSMCTDCPVLWDRTKKTKCPECGKIEVTLDYDGACVTNTCAACGWQVLGFSFYPKCRMDGTIYTVRISREEYTNEHVILLARIFGKTSVEMRKRCSSMLDLETQRKFDDALDIMKKCWDNGLACYIDPVPTYKHYGECEETKEANIFDNT